MLPPPFPILPQAEINFNYFPSLAHYECQGNGALTLNKYVAPGMCLLDCRRRGAHAWWCLGCSTVAGVHHRMLPSGLAGSWAAFAVELLDTQHGVSLKRAIPSAPVGRQHALCMGIWK